MKSLVDSSEYDQTIKLAVSINQTYDKTVIFHCYWNGNLNEKHLYSILSCYYFNVHNHKHKIILWLEKNIPNQYNIEIEKYAELKNFSLKDEVSNTEFLQEYNFPFSKITYYSDFARILLLYNYGGCWFDLDCFFLRSFDPIFYNFSNEICLYQWATQKYPNNAIFISLERRSDKMKVNIEFIINLNKGWGFQEANLTFDKPLNFLVLPCSWFDGSWIKNPYNIRVDDFFENTTKIYNFNNFFKGSFCYHWHNRWNKPIHENSIINQLVKIILSNLENKCIYNLI